ncbi:accessory factor UbiK family protein [Thiotrichales bacterium 19X7-9]|nr:accessory factor UbiK family protein [Thiotrichales bacterium 19X7-9]TNF67537.1 MAG: accessory factor UbiK family protein [Gammaproteobacteria bacterium]UTW42990.1 accessory factor UbiK family protein [bacterium SCSIO 12844]
MLDTKIFDEMAKKFTDSLPPALKSMQEEMEKNFKTILQSTFSKLDLVTKEEFDRQVKVLEKTRGKIDRLEKELDKLLKEKSATTKKSK